MPEVDAGGVRIHYQEWGQPRSEIPLVLLHGPGASSVVWSEVGETLGRTRWTVALDLPGHGKSDPMPDEVSVSSYCQRLGQFLSALSIEQSVLCGHSMGGAIALDRALEAPHQVNKLVLCGSGARLTIGEHLLALVREQFEALPRLLESVAYSPVTPPEVVNRWLPLLLQAPQDQVLADFLACERYDAREVLSKLRVPMLLLVGQDDLLTPPKFSSYLAGQVEGTQLIIVERSGHHLMHEKPDEFVQALLSFVQKRSKN